LCSTRGRANAFGFPLLVCKLALLCWRVCSVCLCMRATGPLLSSASSPHHLLSLLLVFCAQCSRGWFCSVLLTWCVSPRCTGCGGGASESGPAAASCGRWCVVCYTSNRSDWPCLLDAAACPIRLLRCRGAVVFGGPRFLTFASCVFRSYFCRPAAHGAGDSRLRKGQSPATVPLGTLGLVRDPGFHGCFLQTATQEIEKRKQAAEVRLGCRCAPSCFASLLPYLGFFALVAIAPCSSPK
jgi:hypothetical protein